ncbi:MAG: hypothetical protein ACIAXF_17105 [Phycisphaerales bacterium JB063]
MAFDKDAISYFWQEVEDDTPGLSGACGCYVFRIVSGRGAKPWYVGMAEKQTFQKECFQPHKILQYIKATRGRKGRPELLFLAQETSQGRFRKPTQAKRPSICALEGMLIGMGVVRNADLLNVRDTKMYRELEVEGFLNSRKARGGPSKVLRDTFRV